MLYPVLHRLERQGFVAAKWGASETGRRRKYYRITRKGGRSSQRSGSGGRSSTKPSAAIWLKACTRMTTAPGVAARRPDRRSGGSTCAGAGDPRPRRRGARRPSARPDGGAHRRRASRRRGVPGGGQAHGQPRRAVARVRARAFRAAVEAARHCAADADAATRTTYTETLVVLALAVAAALADQGAVAVRHPAQSGCDCRRSTRATPASSCFPLLAVYFVWKRGVGRASARLARGAVRGRSPVRQRLSVRTPGDTQASDRAAPAHRALARRRHRLRPEPLVRRRRAHGLRALLGRARSSTTS